MKKYLMHGISSAPRRLVHLQASVREVKRLDSISRSPVYSSIGEELAGLATIRAYRAEDRLIKRNGDLIDRSVIFSLANQSMNRQVTSARERDLLLKATCQFPFRSLNVSSNAILAQSSDLLRSAQ